MLSSRRPFAQGRLGRWKNLQWGESAGAPKLPPPPDFHRLFLFCQAALKARSEQVKAAYETQMEEMEDALHDPENQPLDEIDFSIPYRTALDKATRMLKNPSDAWEKLDVREKHKLFFFVFERKLAYSIKTGYRTNEITTAARLFEDFVVQNSQKVETGGVEPPCNDAADGPSTGVA